MGKQELSFEEFMDIESKLEIRIGKIENAERIPKSNGLKLTVSFGNGEIKTSFTNLGKTLEPEALIGKICPFIINLTPSVIKGITSEVMIMVATDKEGNNELENYSIGSKLF
jgi:methionyl-tRNA synthetase